ncbi:unnamed protein product, partial [Rotaria magnacalcarata]
MRSSSSTTIQTVTQDFDFNKSILGFEPADQHLNDNGPFGKHHSVHDEPSPHSCNRGSGLILSSIFSTLMTVMTLNVSTTVYVSNEQVNVTWTPMTAPCVDDFIGIYFGEIPLDKACDYFDYEFIKSEKTNSISWQMINLRRPLQFRYYSRDHSCSGNYS